MKKIVKKIPARTVISYQCKVCKTKYGTAERAEKCEARVLEEKRFKIGDTAYSLVKHECVASRRPYRPQGKVIRTMGPMIPDNEYEIYNQKSGKFHIFKYEVEYICPKCNKKHSGLYSAPELRKTEKERLEAIKKSRTEWRKHQKQMEKLTKEIRNIYRKKIKNLKKPKS